MTESIWKPVEESAVRVAREAIADAMSACLNRTEDPRERLIVIAEAMTAARIALSPRLTDEAAAGLQADQP